MILRNLFRRKTRTFLTLIGIAIGIAAIVALGALADGLVANYTGVLTRSGGDLVLANAEAASSAVSSTVGAIEEEVGQAVAAMPEVEEVAGMTFTVVQMPGIPYFVLFGYDPEEFAIRHFKVVEGKMLESGGRGKQAIVGKVAAESLRKKVGDTLKMAESTFRIVGIYETGVSFEDMGAVVSLAEAQALAGQPRKVSVYFLKLKSLDEMEELQGRIERRFPGLAVSRTAEAANKVGLIQTIRNFAWMVSLVAALIGGVGMVNTMMMSVFERRREIGTLRALGWRKGRVLSIILGESFALSLVGGALGVILGIVLVKALGRIPAVASFLPGVLTPGLSIQALVAALVLGAVGGLYPAWRAAGLLPLEALRYEARRGGRRELILARLPGGMTIRNLFRRRGRSLLTVVGVGLGVMAVVAIGGLTDGFIAGFAAIATETDLMVMEADVSDLEFSAIEERVGKRLAAIPGVKHVSGGIIGLAAPEGAPFFVVRGYHPQGYAIRRFKIAVGRGLSASREMILGRAAAERLDKEIGDELKIRGSSYRIVGIYETGNATEEYGGVISLREAQALFDKPHQVSFYAIKAKDLGDVEGVKRRIEEMFPELAVTRSAEFAESTPDIQTMRAVTGAMFFLAVLVGAVGLMNTMDERLRAHEGDRGAQGSGLAQGAGVGDGPGRVAPPELDQRPGGDGAGLGVGQGPAAIAGQGGHDGLCPFHPPLGGPGHSAGPDLGHPRWALPRLAGGEAQPGRGVEIRIGQGALDAASAGGGNFKV